jgi:transposase-like protein
MKHTTPKVITRGRHISAKIKREWVELYWDKKISAKSIAETYGYPMSTIYRVVSKLKTSDQRVKQEKKEAAMIELPDVERLIMDGETPETQLELFIQSLITAISKSPKIKPEAVIKYITGLTNALQRLRSIQLEGLLKTLDAKVVIALIRRLEPNASDLRCVEIFNEVLAEVKSE